MNRQVFEIICGCYEEFLLGYQFARKELTLRQSFAAHDHTSSVRCVAVSNRFVASGGVDDRVFLYDMKTRKEHCSLLHHSATINCLEFTPNGSHLIIGSADGVLSIVRSGNWQVEKIWTKPHKGASIISIAIHRSGKLALTLGVDGTLCTWNLVKGRKTYAINLKSKSSDAVNLDTIFWLDELMFILHGGFFVERWSIEYGGIENCIQFDNKVTACVSLACGQLLVGHENGNFSIIDDKVTKVIKSVEAVHTSRIKSLDRHKSYIVSIDSMGTIKIWKRTRIDKETSISTINTSCRLTCVKIIPSIENVLNGAQDKNIDADDETEMDDRDKSKVLGSKRTHIQVIGDNNDPYTSIIETMKKNKKLTR